MPKLTTPLSIEARTISVDADYENHLPATLVARRDFYGYKRFGDHQLFSDFFERGEANSLPAGLNKREIVDTTFSIQEDYFSIKGTFAASVQNNKITVDTHSNKARLFIFISFKKERSEFPPPEKPDGNYYLSEMTSGTACVLQLEFTDFKFSTVQDLKFTVEKVLKTLSLTASAKTEIKKKLGVVNVKLQAAFRNADATATISKINEMLPQVDNNNFCEKMPELYKLIAKACVDAAQANVMPLSGVYTQYDHQVLSKKVSAQAYSGMTLYILTILSYLYRYQKYYGLEETKQLVEPSGLLEFFVTTLMRLSDPVGEEEDLTVCRAEVDRRFAPVRAKMQTLDQENYLVDGDWVKVYAKSNQEFTEKYLRDPGNIIGERIKWYSSEALWYEKFLAFFPAQVICFLSDDEKRLGLLRALSKNPNVFWVQVKKTDTTDCSRIIKFAQPLSLAAGLKPKEKTPWTHHVLNYKLTEVPAEVEAESKEIVQSHSVKEDAIFVIEEGDDKFLLKDGVGKPGEHYRNCTQFFFSHRISPDRPSVTEMNCKLEQIGAPRAAL